MNSKEKDTVSIFVDYVDELSNDVQLRVLKPADITAQDGHSQVIATDEMDAECLSDGSDVNVCDCWNGEY